MTSSHVRGTLLATVTGLDYWTYNSSTTSPAIADASYQLVIDPDGDPNTANNTTLVYEPYNQNTTPVQDTWEHWDATNGNWWSSKQITCGAFSVAPGAGGPPFTTPGTVGANCPGATVLEVGVDVGSYNPDYTVAVDGLRRRPPPTATPGTSARSRSRHIDTVSGGALRGPSCVFRDRPSRTTAVMTRRAFDIGHDADPTVSYVSRHPFPMS